MSIASLRKSPPTPLGRVGTHINWASGAQPTVKHNDQLYVDYSGVLAGANFALPDAEPVGTKVWLNDELEYSGHTGGMSFSTTLTWQNSYNLPMIPGSVTSTAGIHDGAPSNVDHSLLFTKKINETTGLAYWEVSPGSDVFDLSGSVGTILHPDNDGVAFVRLWGHAPRDEENVGFPNIGWKPRIGDPMAPFFSLQAAYDNGARVFDIGPNGQYNYESTNTSTAWTPGDLVCRGVGETIKFRTSAEVAYAGNISVDNHTADVTTDVDYGDTTWLSPDSPVLTIISESNAIRFGNISIGSSPGADGVGAIGAVGFAPTLTAIGLVAGISKTITLAGGQGGAGSAGVSNPPGQNGENGYAGGVGGSPTLNYTDCSGFTLAIIPGAGGVGGAGGSGDVDGNPGATGAAGAAITSNAALASQALAEAGLDNCLLMSPLRTAQAIAALGGSVDLTGYATETYVNLAVTNLIAAAPTALNDLNELAAALGDDPNYATTITTALGGKQPLNSNLTAIAALTTDAYGRGLLTQTTASLARIYLSLGTMAVETAANYLTTTTAASTYLTIANAASTYLTTATAASTYVPLAGGTLTGALINSRNGAVSSPTHSLVGTWYSGGTATATKPHLLIEPTGTTSTAWDTAGTAIGVNAASGFTGSLLDLKSNNTSQLIVTAGGKIIAGGATATGTFAQTLFTNLATYANYGTKFESTGANIFNEFKTSTGSGQFGIANDAMYFEALSTLSGGLQFLSNSVLTLSLPTNGSVLCGQQTALATTATAGFIYIRGGSGAPTGVPTAVTGQIPLYVDTTNNRFYYYSGGAWRMVSGV